MSHSRGNAELIFAKLSLAIQFAPQGSHAEQSETKQRNCPAAIGNPRCCRKTRGAGFAATGWARENAAAAAKASKSLDTVFMSD